MPTLCLACASEIPTKSLNSSTFRTKCCQRCICVNCITMNPRLLRYNPCLACLGGVSAASSSVYAVKQTQGRVEPMQDVNIDGAIRDADLFILGDDDDLEENVNDSLGATDAPPAYDELHPPLHPPKQIGLSTPSSGSRLPLSSAEGENVPSRSVAAKNRYYIQKSDTLNGISLKLGIDARTLCRLNNLPISTLSTTPHLLHTRSFLTLPNSATGIYEKSNSNDDNGISSIVDDTDHGRHRAREQAEKRFQALTKETDWRIAKAYVALALDPDMSLEYRVAKKEESSSTERTALTPDHPNHISVEAVAIDNYLDDEQWEASERVAGRSSRAAHLRRFKI